MRATENQLRNLVPFPKKPLPDKAEFESFVERLPWSGCWIWMRSMGSGYGDFRRDNRHFSAHRYAYELYKGASSAGWHILHKCDVMGCVNPEHLFLGTNQDNIKDSMLKGRRKGSRSRPSGLKYQRRNPGAYDCSRKTTAEQRVEIRRLAAQGVYQRDIARQFGISQPLVNRIVHGAG